MPAARLAAWLSATLLALALPSGAAAQDRLYGYQDAITRLANTAAAKLKVLIDETGGARFSVAVLPAFDGDLDVVCNPMSEALRTDVFRALQQETERNRLDQIDLVSLQELDEGDVTIRIEWRREGEDLRLDAQLARFGATNVRREIGETAKIRAAEAPAAGQVCLPFDASVFAICELGEGEFAALDDSPSPAMSTAMVAEIRPGGRFRVIAAFDEGRALLLDHTDAEAGRGKIRGFHAGGVEQLRQWRDSGTCRNVRLGDFAAAAAVQEDWSAGRQFTDDCRGCPRMVVLPDGRFSAGALLGAGGVAVEQVRRIAMSETEITMASWQACVEAGACPRPQAGRARDRGMPVSASYAAAEAYAAWLSEQTGKPYRLPTAEEWEFAARGGTETRWPWGDVMRADAAVCAGCASRGVSPGAPDRAGRRAPNAYGLYDMHGNLWEWVADCAGGSAPDGRCAGGRRGLKGGSFRDPAEALDPALTHAAPEDTAHPAIGLRVVRTGPAG